MVAEKIFTPLKRAVVWFWCCGIGSLIPYERAAVRNPDELAL
jgi:hypothetical protein